MRIIPTFELEDPEYCSLWTVWYPEDPVDIFTCLLERWNDTEYLYSFFTANEPDLSAPFWKGMSIDEAIDQVLDEVSDFEEELLAIEMGRRAYTFSAVFVPLDKPEYAFRRKRESFRKGKPNRTPSLIRIYAIELDDGSLVITGGAIKLTRKMDRPYLQFEMKRLERTWDYLKANGIIGKDGFE